MPHADAPKKRFQPYILGRGLAGTAVAEALSILSVRERDLDFAAPVFLGRDSLASLKLEEPSTALLFVANPSGLHAQAILDGERAGFDTIFAEKPACVSLDEMKRLEKVSARVAVLHVYREMWGPRFLRELVDTGRLGEIFAVENRYWQATAAHRAVSGEPSRGSWKNSPELSGGVDALLDLGSHWMDMTCFVAGSAPKTLERHVLHPLAEAPHRDTHVQFQGRLENGACVQGSVSKVVHGAANDLELVLMGTQGTARWSFMDPDRVIVGSGRDANVVTRKGGEQGSSHPTYHALGWIEGYLAIVRKVLGEERGGPSEDAYPVPSLAENLRILKFLMDR